MKSTYKILISIDIDREDTEELDLDADTFPTLNYSYPFECDSYIYTNELWEKFNDFLGKAVKLDHINKKESHEVV